MTKQVAADSMQVGIVHPGQMGVSIAAAISAQGRRVNWVSHKRSDSTQQRALNAKLHDVHTLAVLCAECHYIFSVCPPEHAKAMAQEVANMGFTGTYVDCNAVSPQSSQYIAQVFEGTETTYVDSGIIGPPATKAGTTRLYLSGEQASEVAKLFAGSVVEAIVIDNSIGSASALKMAYAGWTKGSAALLLTQYALAQQQNVGAALMNEWAISLPGLEEQLQSAVKGNSPKAWRFVGEMKEIADTLESSGLSRLWFDGAADTYARLSEFKNRNDVEASDAVSALLTGIKNS